MSPRTRTALLAALALLWSAQAFAHGVTDGDQLFIEHSTGIQWIPFAYLGAKHMVTGYDHLLFLVGVVFFLYRMRDVVTHVTLFSLGHSTTLLLGVLGGTKVDPFLIDAIIGLSVVYKGVDNLGVFERFLGWQPSTKVAVALFGLFHGLGLATKLQDFALDADGLVPNIVAFNVGVEIGQVLALGFVLIAMGYWRRSPSFERYATAVNGLLIVAGLLLTAYQLAGFFGGGA